MLVFVGVFHTGVKVIHHEYETEMTECIKHERVAVRSECLAHTSCDLLSTPN